MSSPGNTRRSTRSSVRHDRVGDADERTEYGLEHTSAGMAAHRRDGLSSDPGSESKADTVPVRDLDRTYLSAADGSAAEEPDHVDSTLLEDETALRRSALRFAA